MSVVVAMGKFTAVQTEYAIKDNLSRDSGRIKAHIVVGTPGTMTDLMRKRIIDVADIKVFVLDEADNMLDQDGLGDQTLRVKKYDFVASHIFSGTYTVTVCFPETTQSRSSFFLPRSPTTSVLLHLNSRPAPTRSSCKRRSSASPVSGNSTWIARTKTTNTIFLSACMHS
jgi:hypothetical protein